MKTAQFKKFAKTFDGHLLYFKGIDFKGDPLYGLGGDYRNVDQCEIDNAKEENEQAEREGWTPIIKRY